MKDSARKIRIVYHTLRLRICGRILEHPSCLFVVVGILCLSMAGDAFAQASGSPIQACSRILGYIEGGFGTLVAAAAGLGAIIAAAVGGFKAAWALLVVSVGCFILRSYLTLFHTGC